MFQTQDVEEIKTHFMFKSLVSENRAIYEIMWRNMAEFDRPQVTIWRKRIACWIPKATNAHSDHVTQCFTRGNQTRITVTFIRKLPIVFIIGTKYVYCAVRNETLIIIQVSLSV